MKKVLFATTALVATAGMAAADVSFGGYGRFGLFYDEGAANDTRLEQRFRLTATGTATSDNGLEFEGRIRFQTDDQANGASNVANRSAAGFAVTSGGFRLDVGHVSDVIDSGDVFSYYGNSAGLTDLFEQSSAFGLDITGFGTSADGSLIAPTIKGRYSFGDFTVSASYTDDQNGDENLQIGVGYVFGNYYVGLAYADYDVGNRDVILLSGGGEVGAFNFSVLIADNDAVADTQFGFALGYDVGAATSIRFAYSDGGTAADEQFGIGFVHNLGGGVSLRGAVGENTAGNTMADLGVRFDF